MNSGQEASPDRPAGETTEADETVEPGNEALQRSQDAIDEGREAAREALQDNPPEADSNEPGESGS
jgi:hypothetical protein